MSIAGFALVSELRVGDEIILPHPGSGLRVIVRESLVGERKILVSKPTAALRDGLMSVPFNSANFDDLQNRVRKIG